MRRPLAFSFAATCLAVGLTLAAAPRDAHAQQPVNDADRAAARNLYYQGQELQSAGRYAEALDRFTRANAVVTAPTTLLHIAECHAALGHLVEAAETYRTLQRFTLPANPPPASVQAVDRGREEMKAIEARVPELRIDVVPAQVPTLEVTIDGQPVNSATIGASRPVNPGRHKVVATAPGYTRAEQDVEIKEKQKLAITLTLQSTGGVIYGPAGASGGTTAPPPVTVTGPAEPTAEPSDKPAPYEAKSAPPDSRSRTSIFFGPRLGLAIPTGRFPTDTGGNASISDVANVGGAFGIEGAIRFARLFYFSALFEGATYGQKIFRNAGFDTTTSASSFLFAGKFGILTNPEGFAFLADVGVGYRNFGIETTANNTNLSISTSVDGPEFLLGVGMHFKAGKWVRLVPKAELATGSFGGGAGAFVTNTDGFESRGGAHTFFLIGLAAYFDINLDKRATASPASPPASTPAPAPATGSRGGLTHL